LGSDPWPAPRDAVFPRAVVQTRIVHLEFPAWKDRKLVAQALKIVYRAVDANKVYVDFDGGREV
jgi:putative transposase